MQESFKTLLGIQELDIKMIRLMRVKMERKKELEKIHALKSDIRKQVSDKETVITEIKKDIRLGETQIKEIQEKIVHFEAQQTAVKKMEEFNALTQEMTAAGRQRTTIEHHLSDLMDKLAAEEDLLVTLRENMHSTEENSTVLEKEILESIDKINEEGRALLQERESLIPLVQKDIFSTYERLLKNKKDRVIVPIENRTCSGCHITLTPQLENSVRKNDRLIFCEHCSRILFWQETEAAPSETTPRRRRRRAAVIG